MESFSGALQTLLNREVAAWLNHPDLKVLPGRLIEVGTDHVVIKAGDQTYFVPFSAIVAVRPPL